MAAETLTLNCEHSLDAIHSSPEELMQLFLTPSPITLFLLPELGSLSFQEC